MNGQNKGDIKTGLEVDVVKKEDQESGTLTRGIVQDINGDGSQIGSHLIKK